MVVNLVPADPVSVINENSPRNHWPKAIADGTIPDGDGLAQRVRLRVPKLTQQLTERDVRKLRLL